MHLLMHLTDINSCLLYTRTILGPGGTEINIIVPSFKVRYLERVVGQCRTVTILSLENDKRFSRRDDA